MTDTIEIRPLVSEDAEKLTALGVRAVYTPKDFNLNTIMEDMVNVIRECNGLERLPAMN